MLLLLFGARAGAIVATGVTITIGASGALSAPVPLTAAPAIRVSVAAHLSPPGFVAASGLTVSVASASLSAPAPLKASAGLTFGTFGAFGRPMTAVTGLTIGTRATITPSPRESASTITIDGVDVKGRVRMKGLTIRDILNDAPNTCRLVMDGDGPAVGQRLRITVNEGARVLFAGTIQTVTQSFEGQPRHVAWDVTAIDDTAAANQKRPFGTWVTTSATTIAQALAADVAPAFSTAGIAADLPPVSIVFDGSDTTIAALARLATAIGGYTKIEDATIYLFIEDQGAAPDPLDAAHQFLHDPPIAASVDASQLRTRVYGKGYGEHIPADLAPGETLVPIQNGVTFSRYGGEAIAATTADGAQSEHLTFTGRELAGGGTLVGPGAAPTVAPGLALAGGAGVDAGLHTVSVVFVTATGKTLASPPAAITVGVHPPPDTAPIAGAALAGTGPDLGTHDYVVSFVTPYGETVPGPPSNYSVANNASGVVGAPGSPTATTLLEVGPQPSVFSAQYQLTFVTATGETDGGALSSVVGGPGFPQNIGAGWNAANTKPGGSLTTDAWYRYFVSYVCANGYETHAQTMGADIFIPAGHSLVEFSGFWTANPDPRVTKVRVYRTKSAGGVNMDPPGGSYGYLVTEMAKGVMNFVEGKADSALGEVSSSTPRGSDPGCQVTVTNIPIGPAGVTGRRLYRRIGGSGAAKFVASIGNNTTTSYADAVLDASLGADIPSTNTTGSAVQRIPLTNIPIGPAGVTARKLYRRINGWDGNPFKLVDTIANNTATTYTDSKPGAALGGPPLTTPTAVGGQIAATVPISGGGAVVTARELYMSPVANQIRRRILVINDNTTAAVTITASDATIATGVLEPAADTSGLQQPSGQVNPGAAVLPVASAATFRLDGGWVVLAGGQVVRYTGVSGQSLVGIPPTGAGAITTTVLYGSQAIPSAMLTGVAGITVPIAKGSAIHIWVQVDDVQAQAEQAARAGGDGVIEFLLVDTRRGAESLTARCLADLAMFARPIVTVAYATRDLKTHSGKTVQIDLASPSIHEALIIQDVTITAIDIIPNLSPRFTVQASSVRFSLEDTLRRLVAGGQIVGGSS